MAAVRLPYSTGLAFFADNRLNLLLIVDKPSRVVFDKAFDTESGSVVPVLQRFQQFANHEILLDHCPPDKGWPDRV